MMLIAEIAKRILREWDEYDYFDAVQKWRERAYDDFRSGLKKPKFKWRKIDANQLKNLYIRWAQYHFIQNPKPLHDIINTLIDNTARLQVNTWLGGHTPDDPVAEWNDEYETEISEQEFEDWVYDYIQLDDGSQYAISDYGLPKMERVLVQMMKTSDENQLFQLLDQALNIVHQRSDFADFYVEGGSKTLSQISGYGFTEPER